MFGWVRGQRLIGGVIGQLAFRLCKMISPVKDNLVAVLIGRKEGAKTRSFSGVEVRL